jgi:hypothetical protein
VSRSLAAVLVLAAALAAPAAGALRMPAWPAPKDPMRLALAAGLVPERAEQLQYHVHSHLDLFVDGEPVTIPAGIGINVKDPAVKSVTLQDGTVAYGGISTPCKQACISPLHTHAAYGLLHTETSKPQPNRLGQFFVEWGVRLDTRCVGSFCRPAVPIRVYIGGKPYGGDPRRILLADRREIAIVIGKPPKKIPAKFPLVPVSLRLAVHRGGTT